MVGKDDWTDEKIAATTDRLMTSLEATKALHTLLLELKRKDIPCFLTTNYSEKEVAELKIFQRRHLLRRIHEETVKISVALRSLLVTSDELLSPPKEQP